MNLFKNKKIKKDYVLAIIPARKGSTRLKNKHLIKINNKSLINYTFESTKKSKRIDKTILFSNDQNIIKISKNYNFLDIYFRPNSISKANSPSYEYVDYVLKKFFIKNNFLPEYILVLQPTSPLRSHFDIDNAIKTILFNKKIDSLISVTEPYQCPSETIYKVGNSKSFKRIYVPTKNKFHPENNQQSKEQTFFIDGSIYIFKTKFFAKTKSFFNSKSKLLKLEKIKGIDINDATDLYIFRKIINK